MGLLHEEHGPALFLVVPLAQSVRVVQIFILYLSKTVGGRGCPRAGPGAH